MKADHDDFCEAMMTMAAIAFLSLMALNALPDAKQPRPEVVTIRLPEAATPRLETGTPTAPCLVSSTEMNVKHRG